MEEFIVLGLMSDLVKPTGEEIMKLVMLQSKNNEVNV